MANTSKTRQIVVLLHGFAAHRSLMTPLAKRFRGAGYETINWGYNSWFKPIDFHAERLSQCVRLLDSEEDVAAIHFVTHSMGCIVARAALASSLPSKTGRWVMLAPPNKGSFIANSVPTVLKKWMKPIDQLQAKSDSYVNQLPMPQDVETGIVQATLDFIVAEPLTYLDVEQDRLVVPGLHSQLLFRDDVARNAKHFLEFGQFETHRFHYPRSRHSLVFMQQLAHSVFAAAILVSSSAAQSASPATLMAIEFLPRQQAGNVIAGPEDDAFFAKLFPREAAAMTQVAPGGKSLSETRIAARDFFRNAVLEHTTVEKAAPHQGPRVACREVCRRLPAVDRPAMEVHQESNGSLRRVFIYARRLYCAQRSDSRANRGRSRTATAANEVR